MNKELENKFESAKPFAENTIDYIESEYTVEEIENNIGEILSYFFFEVSAKEAILSAYPEFEDEIEELQDYLHSVASDYFDDKYFSW